MERFNLHGRIQVVAPDDDHLELLGRCGTITRKLMRDEYAWVNMDHPLPEHLARFPVGDSRRNHIILWPDECQPITKQEPPA